MILTDYILWDLAFCMDIFCPRNCDSCTIFYTSRKNLLAKVFKMPFPFFELVFYIRSSRWTRKEGNTFSLPCSLAIFKEPRGSIIVCKVSLITSASVYIPHLYTDMFCVTLSVWLTISFCYFFTKSSLGMTVKYLFRFFRCSPILQIQH